MIWHYNYSSNAFKITTNKHLTLKSALHLEVPTVNVLVM